MALIDKLSAIGDAIREKNSTTELIPLADMPQAILDIVSGGGGIVESTEYLSVIYNDDDTITLIDKDGITHTMVCTYEDGVLTSVTYDGKAINIGYKDDALNRVGNTAVDLANAKTSGGASLDYTVTFTVDGEPYEIVSVKNGNSVNAPATKPTSGSGKFKKWQYNGIDVTLPCEITGDMNITALFQTVRTEMQLYNEGELIYLTNYTYPRKTNYGLSISGRTRYYNDSNSSWYVRAYLVSTTVEGCLMTLNTTPEGTIDYDGITYYYTTFENKESLILEYGNIYNTGLETDDDDTVLKAILDYYYLKI